MGLLSPIFIIHIFNRYISFGLEGTLIFLMLGALSVAIFEFFFVICETKFFKDYYKSDTSYKAWFCKKLFY